MEVGPEVSEFALGDTGRVERNRHRRPGLAGSAGPENCVAPAGCLYPEPHRAAAIDRVRAGREPDRLRRITKRAGRIPERHCGPAPRLGAAQQKATHQQYPQASEQSHTQRAGHRFEGGGAMPSKLICAGPIGETPEAFAGARRRRVQQRGQRTEPPRSGLLEPVGNSRGRQGCAPPPGAAQREYHQDSCQEPCGGHPRWRHEPAQSRSPCRRAQHQQRQPQRQRPAGHAAPGGQRARQLPQLRTGSASHPPYPTA